MLNLPIRPTPKLPSDPRAFKLINNFNMLLRFVRNLDMTVPLDEISYFLERESLIVGYTFKGYLDLYRTKDYASAAMYFMAAMKLNSNYSYTLSGYAFLVENNHITPSYNFPKDVRNDRFSQAAWLYRHALKAEPKNFPALYNLAALIEQGHVMALDSDFHGAQRPKNNHDAQAAWLYIEAIKLDSSNREVLHRLLNLTLRQLRQDSSGSKCDILNRLVWLVACFDITLQFQNIVDISLPEKQYDQVAVLLRMILKLDPDNSVALNSMAALVSEGVIIPVASDFGAEPKPKTIDEQVAWFYRKTLAKNPNHANALYNLAVLIHDNKIVVLETDFTHPNMLQMNRTRQAICLLSKALLIEPDNHCFRVFDKKLREEFTATNSFMNLLPQTSSHEKRSHANPAVFYKPAAKSSSALERRANHQLGATLLPPKRPAEVSAEGQHIRIKLVRAHK